MINKQIATSPQEEEQGFFHNLKWLRTEEAAEYLRTSVGQIRNMVYRKQLKARKFQRRLYFRRRELDFILEASKI